MVTGAALIASMLPALAAVQVITAPAAQAATLYAPCGTSSDMGYVYYANGGSGTLTCVYVIDGGYGTVSGTYQPSWRQEVATLSVTAIGSGAGGGGADAEGFCGGYGWYGDEAYLSSKSTTSASIGVYYVMYPPGAGGNASPAGSGSPGGDTYVRWEDDGSNTTAAKGTPGGSANSGGAIGTGNCTSSGNPLNSYRNSWNKGGGGQGAARAVGSGPSTGGTGSPGAVIIAFNPPAPTAPQGVSAINTASTPGSLDVSWTAPSNSQWVTRYLATATSSNGGTTRTCENTMASNRAATATTCTVTGLSVGKSYTVSVVPYNALDTQGTSASSSSVTIVNPPVNATAPTISGDGGKYAVGTLITASDGAWTGDTITGYAYQWQSCTNAADTNTCSNLAGAISSTYTPSESDAGKFLRVGVTATNQYGSATAYSALSSSQEIVTIPVLTADAPPLLGERGLPYSYTFQASGGRITYSVNNQPPGLAIDPTTGVLSGVITGAGNVYPFTVTATNDAGSVTSPPHDLSVSDGVPFELVVEQQPEGGPSGAALVTQPVVRVVDEDGRIILTPMSVLVTSSGSGFLGGTTTVTTVSGDASFTNLTMGGLVNTDYTLTFTSGGLSTNSDPVQVTPGAAAQLDIATAPVAASAAGAVMTTQPAVQVEDAFGNLVTYDDTTVVTLTPEVGGFVGPTQASVATATASDGVATFTGVAFGGPTGVPKILTFSAPGLTDDSATVTSTATGAAYKLVVATQATSPNASGATFAQPPVIERQDMAGNTVATDPQANVSATLVGGSPPYDVLIGPETQATVNGVATFAGLGLSGLAGSIYTIRFSSPGLVSADDTVVPSVGAAARLSLTAPNARTPGDASYDDTAFNPQPKVQIVDSGNNPKTVSGVVVTASLVSGTGTLDDDTVATDANGLATFSGLSLDGLVGTYVLRFSASGYTSIDDTVRMLRGAQTVTLAPLSNKTLGDLNFTASAITSSGLLASFSTTTSSVCSVGGAATVTDDTTTAAVSLIGAGTCTIVASQSGNANFESALDDSESFTVSKAAQAQLTLVADDTTVSAGEVVQLATLGGSGSGVVTYAETSDPGTICSVDSGTGVVSFTGTGGSCDFTATKADDTNYLSRTSAALTITIPSVGAGGKTAQTLAFSSTVPASPVDDDTYVAAASATSGLTAQVSVQSGSPATCTATAGASPVTVTFTGAGICVLEATQFGDARFEAASTIVQTIRVYADNAEASAGLKNQSIAFPQPANRRLGTPDFAIAATASSGLTTTYSSTAPGVCTVTVGGIVHLVGLGTCTIVANQAGNATYAIADAVSRSFQVTAGLPSAPRILSVAQGSGSATLAFSAPGSDGGSTILGYAILATPVGAGTTVTSSACSASPCTITGLTSDTSYTLQIAAVNAVGAGPYSVASAPTTPKTCTLCVGAPGSPGPGAPGGPTGARIDDTSITLSWSQPTIMTDDTFVSYDIYYRVSGGSWPSTPHERILAISTTTTTITGLNPAAVYEFLIVVVTTANPQTTPPQPSNPNATTVSVGTPTAPTSPRNLSALYTSDSSIVVSWAYPVSDGGSAVIGYTVSLSPSASCSTPLLDDTTQTATCSVSGLTAGTTYAISVTASNVVGPSIATSVNYTTPGVAPSPSPTPGPNPQPLPPAPPVPPGPQPLPPTPLPPGGTSGEEDGRPIVITPGNNAAGDQLTLTGPNFQLTLTAYDGSGRRIPLGTGPTLRTTPGGRITISGQTYSFSSQASGYLFDRANATVTSATGTVSRLGVLSMTVQVPVSTNPGDYVLQVNGYSLLATTRSANVGVIVELMPWIKAWAEEPRDRSGRVWAAGDSGEIPAGATVTPMVKFKGSGKFLAGTARPVVQDDGSIKWQRKVGKSKTMSVYFTYAMPDTIKPVQIRSNVVVYRSP